MSEIREITSFSRVGTEKASVQETTNQVPGHNAHQGKLETVFLTPDGILKEAEIA